MQDYIKTISRLQREVRDLKTTAKSSPLVLGNFYSTTLSGQSSLGRYRIDYAEGDQPILTELYSLGGAMSAPHGTTQYFWLFSNAGYVDIYLLSTRKILNVEYDPE